MKVYIYCGSMVRMLLTNMVGSKESPARSLVCINSRVLQIGTRVLELHIILLPQSRYHDRNNEYFVHGLSLYQSNSIVICLNVTPISFHEKCEISPVDMTSPDDEVITIRHTLQM